MTMSSGGNNGLIKRVSAIRGNNRPWLLDCSSRTADFSTVYGLLPSLNCWDIAIWLRNNNTIAAPTRFACCITHRFKEVKPLLFLDHVPVTAVCLQRYVGPVVVDGIV